MKKLLLVSLFVGALIGIINYTLLASADFHTEQPQASLLNTYEGTLKTKYRKVKHELKVPLKVYHRSKFSTITKVMTLPKNTLLAAKKAIVFRYLNAAHLAHYQRQAAVPNHNVSALSAGALNQSAQTVETLKNSSNTLFKGNLKNAKNLPQALTTLKLTANGTLETFKTTTADTTANVPVAYQKVTTLKVSGHRVYLYYHQKFPGLNDHHVTLAGHSQYRLTLQSQNITYQYRNTTTGQTLLATPYSVGGEAYYALG